MNVAGRAVGGVAEPGKENKVKDRQADLPLQFELTVLEIARPINDPQNQLIKEITAEPGDDVTLSCRAPNNVNITIVEWSRSNPEKQVYLKRDGHVVTADQDPSYVNRVQLKDDKMKNGELSLILKNVSSNDEGRYECLYKEKTGGRRKRSDINIVIHLNVKDLQIKEITAEPGKDVTLPCEALNYVTITLVEWIISDGSVCKFENRQTFPKQQHPSYLNRVQLKDTEMKNGDLSLTLKNVKSSDKGTYVCIYEGKNGADPIKLMKIVHLHVEGPTAGSSWGVQLGLGLTVAVLALALLVYVIYKKCDD
ncbi:putative selection and upkeep of intraepithelial T-cells protein 1 homolog [Scomber scombrus]|uniref:putative selection and upkeep of intraepithelial T-cells protein 1 homolog n=1 Tax=Scomber scombrus TaxID=13677 RepID=UPI002DDB6435|nr:putative selection and upkeep of intraepithelial T-cells protein 1 homolog [Scomber scombrus]